MSTETAVAIDRDKLARNHLRLLYWHSHRIARKVKKRFGPIHSTADELASLGLVVLAESINRFDAAKGPLSAYLSVSLVRHYLRAAGLRYVRPSVGPVVNIPEAALHLDHWQSVFGHVKGRYGDERSRFVALNEITPDRPNRLIAASELDDGESRWRKALNFLKPRLVDVVVWRFLHDMTFIDIGRRIGVSKQRVCQLYDSAMAKIRFAPNRNFDLVMDLMDCDVDQTEGSDRPPAAE